MTHVRLLLLSTMLVTSATGWGQQKAPASDTGAQLRSLRQQVSAMRRQLHLARDELAAAASVQQSRQMQLRSIEEQVTALRRQLQALRADLLALKANSVQDLNGYLMFDISNGYPTAVFRGVNVQIVNGMGQTQSTNGTGNLIIGYNRPNVGELVCSVGPADSASACATNRGVWAQSHKGGSHNIVGGDFNNYSSWGGLVLGLENTLNAPYAAVLGGARNRAEGPFGSISGGSNNAASGMYSSVSGGFANQASGEFATVSGGFQRSAPRANNWAAGSVSHDH